MKFKLTAVSPRNHTSNMKMAKEPPKREEAKFNQKRMERPEDRTAPKYRYSLRLAIMAAIEKHPNAIAHPTKALSITLQQLNRNHPV